jgi:hypothetical protein
MIWNEHMMLKVVTHVPIQVIIDQVHIDSAGVQAMIVIFRQTRMLCKSIDH